MSEIDFSLTNLLELAYATPKHFYVFFIILGQGEANSETKKAFYRPFKAEQDRVCLNFWPAAASAQNRMSPKQARPDTQNFVS